MCGSVEGTTAAAWPSVLCGAHAGRLAGRRITLLREHVRPGGTGVCRRFRRRPGLQGRSLLDKPWDGTGWGSTRGLHACARRPPLPSRVRYSSIRQPCASLASAVHPLLSAAVRSREPQHAALFPTVTPAQHGKPAFLCVSVNERERVCASLCVRTLCVCACLSLRLCADSFTW